MTKSKTITVKTTLGDYISKRLSRFAGQPAISCLGHTLRYKELDELSNAFAAYLINALGLEPGDRLAIQMPNLLQYPVAAIGAIKAGIVIVNTNPLYTARELRHQLNDSGAKAILVFRGLSGTLAEVIADTEIKTVIVTEAGDLHPALKLFVINRLLRIKERAKPKINGDITFTDALEKGRGLEPPRHLSVPDSLTMLQYTGGTTGVSKGAMLTHANLLSNMHQTKLGMEGWLKDGEEVMVVPLPLYHVYAFVNGMLLGIDLGAHIILISDPRNLKQFIRAMRNVRMTYFMGLNTLFNALCRNESFRKLDFSSLRTTISGGMALMRSTAERWEAITGCKISEGYGLTEASPVVTINPMAAPHLGTVGKLLPATECRLLDSEGKEVAPGEPGELWVRGPQVMKGYWNRPDATREVIDEEGWLHTGDIAVMDSEGYLSIVDRLKDMIVVSGFNVYPNEVEDEINKHPQIVECAVIGVPDEDTVEAVKVFVVQDGDSLTAQEVRDFARNNLTAYNVPKHVEFIDELPKSNVGKVLRKELRDK